MQAPPKGKTAGSNPAERAIFLSLGTLTMDKTYITADSLLTASYELALNIYESGYRPDFIVGVWRGGTPIGIAVQEILRYLGVETDHIAIRTSSYIGIGERSKEVSVHGLGYIVDRIKPHQSLLIIDDVYDTGLSIQQIIHDMHKRCGDAVPDIKVATPYFKPSNNKTSSKPDYFLYETEKWLVFPHEMMGLGLNEACENKTELAPLKGRITKLMQSKDQ